MLRLALWIASFVFLGAFAVVGATVPLGEHTLFGHFAAIGRSRESQELVRSTKDTIGGIQRRVGLGDDSGKVAETRGPAGKAPAAAGTDPAPGAQPQDSLTDRDRREMRRLIGSARGRPPK